MQTEEALQIVALFEKARLLRDPFIQLKCAIFLQTGDARPIQELITENPDLINMAVQAAAEEDARPFKIIEPEELEKVTGDITLGIIDDAGHKAGINPEDLTTHMGIFARIGEGKSIFIETILDQLFSKDKDFNVLVFDPKGDYKHMIRKHPKLLVLQKDTIRYNHFQILGAGTKDEIVTAMKRDIEVCGDALYFAEIGLPLIEDAVDELYRERGIYSKTNRWPTPEDVLKKILFRNKEFKTFNVKDVLNRIDLRFRSLIKSRTFNTRFGYSIDFWTDNDIIIDLDGFSTREAALLAIGLAIKIYDYNKRKDLRGHKLRTLIVIDEAYQFFNAELDNVNFATNYATKNLFLKAREFGIGFLIASQRLAAISQYVRDNLSTIAALRNTDDALKQIQNALGLKDEQVDFLRELEHKFTGIIKLPTYPRPMIFDLDFDEFPKKDIDDSEIWERVRPVLEEFKPTIPTFPGLPGDQDTILNILKGSPYLYKKLLLAESGLSQNALNEAIAELLKAGFITSAECYVSRRKAEFYPLTDQGFDYLKTPAGKRYPKELKFRHDYYKRRIYQNLKKQGYNPRYEYAPEGLSAAGKIDVYAAQENKSVAYEMTISTKNLLDNIRKCLEKMRMDKLYIVTEPRQKTYVEKKIKDSDLQDSFKERTEVVTIIKFLSK